MAKANLKGMDVAQLLELRKKVDDHLLQRRTELETLGQARRKGCRGWHYFVTIEGSKGARQISVRNADLGGAWTKTNMAGRGNEGQQEKVGGFSHR